MVDARVLQRLLSRPQPGRGLRGLRGLLRARVEQTSPMPEQARARVSQGPKILKTRLCIRRPRVLAAGQKSLGPPFKTHLPPHHAT